MRKLFVLAMLAIVPVLASAAGPDTVARADRSLWPDAIDTPAGFDRASRAEILLFAAALADEPAQDAAALKERLHIKEADTGSVEKIRERLLHELLKNWQAASAGCQGAEPFCPTVNTAEQLEAAGQQLGSGLPPKYQAWLANAQLFHKHYADELIRLAALFPHISSEIDLFTPQERNGFELPDRTFMLTFDDGPTDKGGNTDTLLRVLRQQGIHAPFFMLGERLQARLQQQGAATLAAEYAGQCTALHGWQHLSHAKWPLWQGSVTRTRDLVKQTFPDEYQPWFRPPYGQRRSDSGPFFTANGLHVVLWNMDSQDWNAHITQDEAAQRVMSLMLLWRRGMILFHDIHTKAPYAVPWLISHTQHTGVIWEDCRRYGNGV